MSALLDAAAAIFAMGLSTGSVYMYIKGSKQDAIYFVAAATYMMLLSMH